MRTIVRGKNIEVADRLRQYAERKLDRVERLLDDRSEAVLELSIEQHRSDDASHIAELTLMIDGQPVRTHAAGPTHRAAIDTATDKAERRAVDHKEKPLRDRSTESRLPRERPQNEAADPATEPRIVKTKRFGIEPMFEEDAVAAMEELGHSFFIFVNAEDERLNVLYRRVDGNYGIIEPVIGGAYTSGRPSRAGRAAGTPTQTS